MNAISVRNLSKHFGSVKALQNVSFSVKNGEIMGFLGPNGAGKSTTIKAIMNFINPDSGEISVFGQDVTKHSAEIKQDIGFLNAEVNLFTNWTGQEHIHLAKKIRNITANEHDLIERLHLNSSKKVQDLSTGNRQKLGIVLAVLHEPKLLILDEPTIGLDPLLQATFYEIIRELAENGTTILMSSHNLSEVENVCDRVTIIKQGSIVDVDTIKTLRKKRLYQVEINADTKILKEIGRLDIFEKISCTEDTFTANSTATSNEIIDALVKFELDDLEISHASLEKIFMEYYQ